MKQRGNVGRILNLTPENDPLSYRRSLTDFRRLLATTSKTNAVTAVDVLSGRTMVKQTIQIFARIKPSARNTAVSGHAPRSVGRQLGSIREGWGCPLSRKPTRRLLPTSLCQTQRVFISGNFCKRLTRKIATKEIE